MKSSMTRSWSTASIVGSKSEVLYGLSAFPPPPPSSSKSNLFPVLSKNFIENPLPLAVSDHQTRLRDSAAKGRQRCSFVVRVSEILCFSDQAEAEAEAEAGSGCVRSRAVRWWEKNLKPNMIKIGSAQQLVDCLRSAGDRLVVVHFYSPACGGCKSLHPKICQLAELHPDATFVEVNHEDLGTMCKCLNVHVLPFFRFFRGAQGRVCSFSCTNATIKKFKDALTKYGTDGSCSLGPAKGLDEQEVARLVASGELRADVPLSPVTQGISSSTVEDLLTRSVDFSGSIWKDGGNKLVVFEEESALHL